MPAHTPLHLPLQACARRCPASAALGVALLGAALLLPGCASGPQGTADASASKAGTNARSTVSPAQQAELDAAMALVRAKQYEPGLEALGKLASKMPDQPIPLINMALVYKELGKPEQAEATLKQALAIEPGDPLAANELALLYRKQGRFAAARPIYESTLARYPNFAIAHKNLGVLCDLYLRDYECALRHYTHYSVFAPEDKNVKIWIADLQKRLATK